MRAMQKFLKIMLGVALISGSNSFIFGMNLGENSMQENIYQKKQNYDNQDWTIYEWKERFEKSIKNIEESQKKNKNSKKNNSPSALMRGIFASITGKNPKIHVKKYAGLIENGTKTISECREDTSTERDRMYEIFKKAIYSSCKNLNATLKDLPDLSSINALQKILIDILEYEIKIKEREQVKFYKKITQEESKEDDILLLKKVAECDDQTQSIQDPMSDLKTTLETILNLIHDEIQNLEILNEVEKTKIQNAHFSNFETFDSSNTGKE